MRLVLRAGRRTLWRHPLQLLLAVTGVTIGVAVVVSVNLANQSAATAMRLAVDAVAGKATHQIVGGPNGLPQSLYVKLRTDLGIRRIAPIVEGGATTPGAEDRPLTLMGVDPFAEAPFRSYLANASDGGNDLITDLLTQPDLVVLPKAEARRLHVAVGDTLTLRVHGQSHQLNIAALIDANNRNLSGLAFTDIAVAQRLLGQFGHLDRIDLILEDQKTVAAVRNALPSGARLIPAASRANALVQMTDAFQLNLTALSLLALVVGLFLVFNTMSFLVVRRRALLGTLRALGATRAQVMAQVLADAVLIGGIGTILGLLCGIGLATVLVDLVLQTVQALYFERAVGGLRLTAEALAPGVLLGLFGTLAAALAPAREAAAVAPRAALARSDLEARTRRGVFLAALAGMAVLAAGAGLLVISSNLVGGFTGLFAVILGFTLAIPWATAKLGHWLARGVQGHLGARLAVNGAVASLSRTGVAVAALAVAVSAVIGVGVMIDSFRASVVDWLHQSLSADFYVDTPHLFPNALADQLADVRGVDYISRTRHYRQTTTAGYTQIRALGLPRGVKPSVERVRSVSNLWQQWRNDRAVLISEPFAWERDLTVGDQFALRTGSGQTTFEVAGIFRDYGATTGVVLMRLGLFRTLWDDTRLSGVGVYAAPSSLHDELRKRIDAELAGQPGARVVDNQVIFNRSMAVFDRTFLITSVLRLLAALVAFVGVLGALMALQLDRAREYATLRALGLRRRTLAGLITAQSTLLGLAASLFAVPLGLVLAWLLVFVINRRAFGWTMDFAVRGGPLMTGVLLAVGAALLAALYPAWRAAHATPAQALREE